MSALLVVRPSSLGDVVHALALVTDVIAQRPGTVIDWVAEPAFAELPALCPDVRSVVPFALRRWRQAPLDRQTWRDIAAFRRAVRATRYDVILDLQEQIKGGVIARTARGVRHGFDRASIREPAATCFDDVHHRIPRDAALRHALPHARRGGVRIPARGSAALASCAADERRRRTAVRALCRRDARDVPRWQAVAGGATGAC